MELLLWSSLPQPAGRTVPEDVSSCGGESGAGRKESAEGAGAQPHASSHCGWWNFLCLSMLWSVSPCGF